MAVSGKFQEDGQGPETYVEGSRSVFDNIARARDIAELERLRVAAVQTGHAAYHWNTITDTMAWSGDAEAVLEMAHEQLPQTGKAYADIIAPEARTQREDLILDNTQLDDGNGVEFDTSYDIGPGGEKSVQLKIEERGRLRIGQDGRVSEVYGIVRKCLSHRSGKLDDGLLDPETFLSSRQGILSKLSSLMNDKTSNHFGVLVLSISNIGSIASTYGAMVIPDVIRAVATRLRSVMRGVDILGRTGSSQFTMLLRECSSEQIQVAGERFISAIRDDVIETFHGPVWVELSAGGVILPIAGVDGPRAFSMAEEAVLQAETDATQCYITYQLLPDRLAVLKSNRDTAREIIEALNSERFTIWHQPIVDSRTREIFMYESLLRMQTPEGEIIPASHLVPVAEKLGLLHMIDVMVCRTSIDLVRSKPDAMVTFNLSEGTLCNAYATSRIKSLIAESSGLASRLCIELSFGSVNAVSTSAVALLQNLREMGCKIALSGYFVKGIGLNALKSVDLVKLDGPLCVGVANRPGELPLLKAAIDFARKAGPKVIAEHIETEEDAAILTELGADYLQGYLFGGASSEYFNLTLSKLDDVGDPVEATQPASEVADVDIVLGENSAPEPVFVQSVETETSRPVMEVEDPMDLLKSALGKLDSI